MLKIKGLIITLPAIRTVTALTLCLVAIFSFTGGAKDATSNADGVYDPRLTYTDVQKIGYRGIFLSS